MSEVLLDANLCQVEKVTAVPGLGIDLLELCLEECADAASIKHADPRRGRVRANLLDALRRSSSRKIAPRSQLSSGQHHSKSREVVLRKRAKSRFWPSVRTRFLSIDESLSVFPASHSMQLLYRFPHSRRRGLLQDHPDDQPLTRISKRRTASAVTPVMNRRHIGKGDAMIALPDRCIRKAPARIR